MLLHWAQNMMVLVLCWILTAAGGFYYTFVHQPKEIEELKKAEKVITMKNAEMATLLAEASSTRQKADEALARWNARYKIMPDTLTSPAVVDYLNRLTQTGFDKFDITLSGVTRQPDFKFYTYEVKGNAYFGSLYRMIWQVENSSRLFRIRNVSLEHTDIKDQDRLSKAERMKIMVSFTMLVDAYFGGQAGMSAGKQPGTTGDGFAIRVADSGIPVPSSVLPDQRPAINPFFPIILDEIPPNTYNLVDVEKDKLVAIVGSTAVFETEAGMKRVPVKGAVYLGHVQSVDPELGRVVIYLNRGGIADQVELNLHAEGYRQAFGPQQLAPTSR